MTMRRILAVGGKEILDSARDRRTLLVSLLTAVAAGPRVSSNNPAWPPVMAR